MLKLLLCLVTAMLLAVVVLQLRQQRLDLSYQNNKLHNRIEAQQAKLWNQQLNIAISTAPNAIAHNVGLQGFKMVPQSPLPSGGTWSDPEDDPNAE